MMIKGRILKVLKNRLRVYFRLLVEEIVDFRYIVKES